MNQQTKLLIVVVGVVVGLMSLLAGAALVGGYLRLAGTHAPAGTPAPTWHEVAAEHARLREEMHREAQVLRERHPGRVPEKERQEFYDRVDEKDRQLITLQIQAVKQHGAAPTDVSTTLTKPLIVEARQTITSGSRSPEQRLAQAKPSPPKMPQPYLPPQPTQSDHRFAEMKIPEQQLVDAQKIRASVRQRTKTPENPSADQALTSVQMATLDSMNRAAYELENRRWSSADRNRMLSEVAQAERLFAESGEKEILRKKEVAERERFAAQQGEITRKQQAEIDARAKLEREKNPPLTRLPGEDDVDYLRRVSIQNLKRLRGDR